VTRIACAWCDAGLGEKPGPDGVTHSICAPCKRAVRPPADDEINTKNDDKETT
jgi:hypothetical protein